jgi:hypothetical protein
MKHENYEVAEVVGTADQKARGGGYFLPLKANDRRKNWVLDLDEWYEVIEVWGLAIENREGKGGFEPQRYILITNKLHIKLALT